MDNARKQHGSLRRVIRACCGTGLSFLLGALSVTWATLGSSPTHQVDRKSPGQSRSMMDAELIRLVRMAADHDVKPTSLDRFVGFRPEANSFLDGDVRIGDRRMRLLAETEDGQYEDIEDRLKNSRGFAYWFRPTGADDVIGIVWPIQGGAEVFFARFYCY
jgi:hypothetical protein